MFIINTIYCTSIKNRIIEQSISNKLLLSA